MTARPIQWECKITSRTYKRHVPATLKALIMAALRSRCGYYILSCGFIYLLLSSLFFISSPNLSRRRLDV